MSKLSIRVNQFGSANSSLILLSGWLHPWKNEPRLLELLQTQFSLHIIDLPGYDTTPSANAPYTFKQIADEISQIIPISVRRQAVWLGYSMGCKVITEYAKQYHQPDKCLLIGCQPKTYPVPTWANVLIENQRAKNITRKSSRFKTFAVEKALRTITKDPKAKFNSFSVTLDGAYDSLIALLTSQTPVIPTLEHADFIYGEHDPYLEDAKSARIQRLHQLPGKGHDCIKHNERRILNLVHSLFS